MRVYVRLRALACCGLDVARVRVRFARARAVSFGRCVPVCAGAFARARRFRLTSVCAALPLSCLQVFAGFGVLVFGFNPFSVYSFRRLRRSSLRL